MDYYIEGVRNIDSPSVARGLRYFSTQESGYKGITPKYFFSHYYGVLAPLNQWWKNL
jgi:hypothetical protein